MPPLPQTPLTGAPKMGMPAPQPLTAPAALAPPPIVRCFRVAPPMMAPLAPTPPPKPAWMAARNPSAHIVQQQYVDLRLEELEANRKPGRKAALAVLQELLLRQPRYAGHKKVPGKELQRIYEQIERNLQSADLTINFMAEAWFTSENTYETYTQMYQRNVTTVDGKMILKDGGTGGAAGVRAVADNNITFPEHWQGAPPPVPPRRGLSPGPQGAGRIMAQMHTGKVEEGKNACTLNNRHFNPNTKQIFMGLNYGRRPHGSSATYGHSYLVLKSSLKARALYYPGDTFLAVNRTGVIRQASYDNLGALLALDATATSVWGLGEVTKRNSLEILQSCYEGNALPDSMGMEDLLEAHHFGELRFRDHVDHIVISPTDNQGKNWPAILENARKFATRNGIKLYQTS
jgi:hypothetical protein